MNLSIKIKYQDLLRKISRFADQKKIRLYLVGGVLRDLTLRRERENPDIDFCLKRGAINFGGALAKEIRAGFVILDKEHGCCRLVKKFENKVYTLDFSDFRGKAIADDLLHRDFTINAMAAELSGALKADNLDNLVIDPYGARTDLKSRLIRVVKGTSFDEDPLRILRAFSLAAIFDFKIDRQTLRLARLKKKKLLGVSYERIRDELFKILDLGDAYKHLLTLDRLKIIQLIIPEIESMRGLKQGPYHHLDVWAHTLETIKQLENLMQELKNNGEVRGYLDEFISAERRRRALIKLGALLHDIGKPKALRREEGKTKFHGHEKIGLEMTEEIARRLRLSNDELDSLRKMVFWHLRPGYLADIEQISERAIFRYFRDTAQEGLSILLLSLADQRATRGPLTTKESRLRHEKVVLGLIKRFFKEKKKKKLARLISGDDLINKFNLEPSPLIGKILREIEELQAIGKIKTKKEALSAARKLIK